MSEDGRPRNEAACRRILRAQNHYDVLEVSCQSAATDIKAAFRRKALEVHPDKNASPLASEAFKRLQKASDLLTDASLRSRYDMFGDEEPHIRQPSHQREYSYERGYKRNFGYNQYPYGREGQIPPFAGLMPFIAALLVASFLFLAGGALLVEHLESPQHRSNRQRQRGPPRVVQLTRSNADVECGIPGRQQCVVLLTDPRHGFRDREFKLLEKVRAETEQTVTNSRGQRLSFTWTTATAAPGWQQLLPSKATFPWVVVLKATRGGLRGCSMPVSKAGGKEKGRLSTGVPKLLQEIAAGSAKFEPLKGNVSALFGR